MKPLASIRSSRAGFTLFEMLINLGIVAAMLAAALAAGVSATKSLYVADDYSNESNEQLRAMDYLARDIRGALTFSIPGGGSSLTLTLPDYYTSYDAMGNPPPNIPPRNPVIANGLPGYGNTALPILVTYSVSGSTLIRQQTIQATNAVTTLVVCSNVNAFQLNFVALSTTIKYSITFLPKLQFASTALRAGTTLSGTVCARTMRIQLP